MSDLALQRHVLNLLYDTPNLTAERIVANLGLVNPSTAPVVATLSLLRKDRLVEILGPAGGPYEWRLSRSCRACLRAVSSL